MKPVLRCLRRRIWAGRGEHLLEVRRVIRVDGQPIQVLGLFGRLARSAEDRQASVRVVPAPDADTVAVDDVWNNGHEAFGRSPRSCPPVHRVSGDNSELTCS